MPLTHRETLGWQGMGGYKPFWLVILDKSFNLLSLSFLIHLFIHSTNIYYTHTSQVWGLPQQEQPRKWSRIESSRSAAMLSTCYGAYNPSEGHEGETTTLSQGYSPSTQHTWMLDKEMSEKFCCRNWGKLYSGCSPWAGSYIMNKEKLGRNGRNGSSR